MKIWQGEGSLELPGYSIAETLLFDVLAQALPYELTPCEQLHIARNAGLPVHALHLVGIYMACGCFEEAKYLYAKAGHPRKLGDISWLQGRLDEAENHYSSPVSKAQSYRDGPDYDRLIKLAFFRRQWDRLVDLFPQAPFSCGVTDGHVILGSSETAAKPFLQMLAVALHHTEGHLTSAAETVLREAFAMGDKEWDRFRSTEPCDERTILKLQRRCPPRFARLSEISMDLAAKRGRTDRAERVLSYLRDCDKLLPLAQQALELFVGTGEEEALAILMDLVTKSGITSVSHSFLFVTMGHDSFAPKDVPPERLVRLYGGHPIMNKRYFGRLLDVKFAYMIPLTACEVITGLFQQKRSISALLDFGAKKDRLDVPTLAYFREWAEIRLSDWLRGTGAEAVESVARIWRDGRSQAVASPFGGGTPRPPDTPRDMVEWAALIQAVGVWLETRWKREIARSPWVSENQVYQVLEARLKPTQVIQHAQPVWLLPQHLDVYIPEASAAVEFMGQQHFQPVDLFGGEEGLLSLQRRDRKKAEICEANGVRLYQIRYDEDIGKRATEIAGEIGASISTS